MAEACQPGPALCISPRRCQEQSTPDRRFGAGSPSGESVTHSTHINRSSAMRTLKPTGRAADQTADLASSHRPFAGRHWLLGEACHRVSVRPLQTPRPAHRRRTQLPAVRLARARASPTTGAKAGCSVCTPAEHGRQRKVSITKHRPTPRSTSRPRTHGQVTGSQAGQHPGRAPTRNGSRRTVAAPGTRDRRAAPGAGRRDRREWPTTEE